MKNLTLFAQFHSVEPWSAKAKAPNMAEILIKDSDLSGLKGKVVIVTGTYNSCGPSPALESPECHHARDTRQPAPGPLTM